MMRLVFLLVLLAGVGLAGYPWLAANFLDHPVGTWRIYDIATGFMPATMQLQESDTPLEVVVDMTTTKMGDLPADAAVLTVTATTGGRTVLAKALTFAGAAPRDTNPQMREKVFSETAGIIDPVRPGAYVFTFGKGDAEGVPIQAADLILRAGGSSPDERLRPIGFSLAAIGFIGFVLAVRYGAGGRPGNPNSQPPPPRWGRGGGTSA